MKQNTRKFPRPLLLAVFLLPVLAIALSACGSPVRDDYFAPAYHTQQTFAQLDGAEYNSDIYQAQTERFLWLLEQKDSQEELFSLYEWLSREYDTVYTQYSLASIAYYQDVRDEDAEQAIIAATDGVNRAAVSLEQAEQAALNSPRYGKAFAKATGLVAATLPSDGERLLALQAEENQLITDYTALVQAGFQAEVEGQVWTMETLDAAQADLDQEAEFRIRQAIYGAESQGVAELYLQLVANRQEQAALYGYDNYCEYAYQQLYGRDYLVSDAESMEIAAKDKLGAAYFEYQQLAKDCLAAVNGSGLPWDGASSLAWLEENVTTLSPEVAEAYAYLKEKGCYDLDASPGKLPGMGFTAGLPIYGSAFILLDGASSFDAYMNLAHEFGHFLAVYQQVCDDSSCSVDLAESHSQGMEMLCLPFYQGLLGDLTEEAQFYTLYRRLDYLVNACIEDEFQQLVYSTRNLDEEKLAQLYYQVCSAYGKPYPRGVKADYGWCGRQHTFDAPLYVVSYATSSLTAIDLWLQGQDDPNIAIDRYLTLLSVSADADFLTALDSAEQDNFTTPGYVRRVGVDLLDAMARLAKHLDVE